GTHLICRGAALRVLRTNEVRPLFSLILRYKEIRTLYVWYSWVLESITNGGARAALRPGRHAGRPRPSRSRRAGQPVLRRPGVGAWAHAIVAGGFGLRAPADRVGRWPVHGDGQRRDLRLQTHPRTTRMPG